MAMTEPAAGPAFAAATQAKDVSDLRVATAQLVVKLDALSDSMKLSVERLIEKIDTGDRQGAQLFRLIEERLASYQAANEPKIMDLRAAVNELERNIEARLAAVNTQIDTLEGWRNRVIGGMAVAAALGGGVGAGVAKLLG